MKPGIPWSIKGIESETREAAKSAARSSGLTLGQWMNQKIQEESRQAELLKQREIDQRLRKKAKSTGKKRKSSKSKTTKVGKLNNRLDNLSEQLSSLASQYQETAVNSFVGYENEENATRAMESLIERIENNEGQTQASFDAVTTRLEAIDEKITDVQSGTNQEDEKDSGYEALETAVRNIVEHIETSEKRNRDSLSSMQDRLSEMGKRAEVSQNDAASQTAPAIATLEARIADLGLQLNQATKSDQSETRSYIDEKLGTISEQIDAVRHSTDAMTKRAETSAKDVAKKEVYEVEQRVASLIGEARNVMLEANPAQENLNLIHGEIESLNQRFDDIKSDAASDRDVEGLKLAVEQLASNAVSAVDMTPLTAMEQRLGELTHRLDETSKTDHMAPQFAELDQRIASLDQQLAHAIESQDDAASFAALETQIAVIGDRLSSTEEKLGNLATIEQSISKLYSSFEENRTWTQEVANEAASRMAQDVLAQGIASTPVDGSSPELQALQQGLEAVKQNSQAAETHNQETLEAVHETLEQIITKLTDLEARDAKDAVAHAVAATAVPVMEQPIVQPVAQPVMENVMGGNAHGANAHDGGNWQASVQSHLQEEVAVQAPPLPGIQPMSLDGHEAIQEPVHADVSPAFHPEQAPQGTPEIDVPAEPLVVSATPQVQEPEAPLDYIAQARLASQSAATQSSNAISKGAGFFSEKLTAGKRVIEEAGGNAKGSKSLFSLPFLSKKKVKAAEGELQSDAPTQEFASDAFPTAKKSEGSNRKRLVLAGLVLLIAAGAFAASKFTGKSETSAMAPAPAPAITQPQKTVPQKVVTPKQTSEIAPQSNPAQLAVQKVSFVTPLKKPSSSLVPNASGRNGMPTANALEGNDDPVMSAPTDPVVTASLPPAPNHPQTNINSPLNIKTAVQKTPPASVQDIVASNIQLPPKEIGTVELRQAAAGGDPSAQFVIASRYIEGKSVKRDFSKAASWYQKAASNNLAPAQYRLGTLFERGNGLPKDINAARLWYERAAENGNVKAMHNLAVIYASAKGGKPDFAKAKKWFEQASLHGLKDSQFNLAVIFERGLATKRSQKDAFIWYSLAAARGDRDAGVKAHSLKNYLSDADRKSASLLVASWTPKRPNKSGNFVAIKDAKWQVASKRPVKRQPKAEPNLSGKALVSSAQTMLSKLGFNVGTPDGIMGTRTANAVRLFQLQNGLSVNGMVSNALLKQLQART